MRPNPIFLLIALSVSIGAGIARADLMQPQPDLGPETAISDAKSWYLEVSGGAHPTNYGAYQSRLGSGGFRIDFDYDLFSVLFPLGSHWLVGVNPRVSFSFVYGADSSALNFIHFGPWLVAQYFFSGRIGSGMYLDAAGGPSYVAAFTQDASYAPSSVFSSWGVGAHLGWGYMIEHPIYLGLSIGFFSRLEAIRVMNTNLVSGTLGVTGLW